MKFKTNILRQQQIGFEACKLILNDLSPRAVSEPMNRLNEHEVSHIPFFCTFSFFAIYCMKFISASKYTHSKNSCSTRSKSERKVCSPAYCNLIHYTLLFFVAKQLIYWTICFFPIMNMDSSSHNSIRDAEHGLWCFFVTCIDACK